MHTDSKKHETHLRENAVSTRSCMSCFNCKVRHEKTNETISVFCFKGIFGITYDHSQLSKHQDCTMFVPE